MSWHKWKRILHILNGPSKHDRQVEQRRARRRSRQADPEQQPRNERFWERWNTRQYT